MSKSRLSDYSGPAALHLWTLCTLSLAHPLYAVLDRADHLPFFTAHQARSIDVWLFVLFLSFALPAVLCFALWAIRLVSARFASALYLLLMFLLFLLLWLPVPERWFGTSTNLTISLSLSAAVICAALYVYTAWARSFLSIMSMAIIVSPLLFLTSASIRTFTATPEARNFALGPRSENRPDIVMIVFDELPIASLQNEDHEIDPVRFPNFHRLAETSTWYRNTLSVHYTTSGALPSLLIGEEFATYAIRQRQKGPNSSAAVDRSNVPENLFTLLDGPYQVAAIESTSKLAPKNDLSLRFAPPLKQRFTSLLLDSCVIYAHIVVPAAMRVALPNIEGQWSGYVISENAQQELTFPGSAQLVKQFLQTLQKTEMPTLFYLHVLLPHFPFTYSDHGASSDNKFKFLSEQLRKATGKNQWPGEIAANLAWQAHLLQVGFTDFLLGKVLDKMVELDIFDDSVVIATADHGLSFYWDSSNIGQEKLALVQASETLLIPFFLKMPGQELSLVSDAPVQNIDIVPTIADLADLDIPWQVGGLSVFSQIPKDRTRFARAPDKREYPAVIDPEDLALKRKSQLFGSGDPRRLYRSGPRPEIIGHAVSSFSQSAILGSVQLDHRERYDDIDLGQQRLPVYIEGEISRISNLSTAAGIQLAIAVNGIVQSTTVTTDRKISDLRKEDLAPKAQSVEQPSSASATEAPQFVHFLSRVPPESFKDGANNISIFAILDGTPDGALTLGEFNIALLDDEKPDRP